MYAEVGDMNESKKTIYKGRSQKEDVFTVLAKLGGKAQVKQIYEELEDTWEQKHNFDLNDRDKWHKSIRSALGSLQYDGLVENIKAEHGYWRISRGDREYSIQEEDYNFSTESSKLFSKAISGADRSVKILTFAISFKGVENVFQDINAIDAVTIVTNRRRDTERIKQFLIEKGIRSVEIKRCKNLHAKVCIIDENKVIIGSSNLTAKSLGFSSNSNIEANILSENRNVIEKSLNLFNSLFNRNAGLTKEEYKNEDFLSSISGIPTRIVKLMKNSNEILIILPSMIRRDMFGIFKMINDNAKIKVMVHWPRTSSIEFKTGLKALRAMKNKNHISLIPVRENIHAKVYIFKNNGEKIAFISSLNMTESSWDYYIEAGLLTNRIDVIEDVEKRILEHKEFNFHGVVMEDPDDKNSKGEGIREDTDEIEELQENIVEGQNYIDEFSELLEKFKNKYAYVYEEDNTETDIIVRPMSRDIFNQQVRDLYEVEGFTGEDLDKSEITKERLLDERKRKRKIDGHGYLYCALLLHYGKQPVTKENISKILDEQEIDYDPLMIDALMSCLKGVNINEAIER